MNDLESQKLLSEVQKLNEETKHYVKKNRYFEMILIISAFVAGAVWVKFFG